MKPLLLLSLPFVLACGDAGKKANGESCVSNDELKVVFATLWKMNPTTTAWMKER